MSEKNIHIAVIVSTIDEEYQSDILSGIRHFAADNRITLEHFVAFGNVGGDTRHDTGEYNIFNLANFRKFDGVILVINTIQLADSLENVIAQVRKASIPAVFIDKDVPGFYTIGIDNETAMQNMVEHFIVKHGFTRINYVSGPADNVESQLRLRAYRSTLERYGIPVEEERIYHGNFMSKDGTAAVHAFMNSPLEFPQAIICANDLMAIAAMNALSQNHLCVPEDVAVSGFDYTHDGRNFSPSLTSVQRPLVRGGRLACEIILNHIRGIPQERSVTLDTKCLFSESCGCRETPIMDINEFKQRNFNVLEHYTNDISLVSRMSSALAECDHLDHFAFALRKFIPEMQCEEFYLCLCDGWRKGIMMDETEENYMLHILSPSDPIVSGFGESVQVALAYKNGETFRMEDFPVSEMLPGLFDPEHIPGNYYFVPLHFRERCIGYCVFRNSAFPTHSKLFNNAIMTIANALESVRKIICLDQVSRRLTKLYTIDPLANINNRNGFRISTQQLYSYCINARKPVMLMFLDMDGLKTINDTYGHKDGDNAIIALSDTLRTACSGGEICCRFGGDEFIVFAADYTEERAQILRSRIQQLLDEVNENSMMPYTIAASIGYHIAVPDRGMDLFQLVTIADNIMYAEKKKKKTSRYLKRRAVLPVLSSDSEEQDTVDTASDTAAEES